MNQSTTIALYQPLLQRIAYSLLQCKADAEDIVQDTFLKWLSIDHEKIDNTKAYLVQAVRNNCLNHLNTLKKKKEECWDSIQLSQWVTKFKEIDFSHIDFDKELSSAFKLFQSKLEPLERAAYLLKEIFGFDYAAIQAVLGKKADHCRQLLSRARKKLNESGHNLKMVELPNASQFFQSFKKACDLEHFSELISHLKRDIALQKKD